jgi:hypothetical protein
MLTKFKDDMNGYVFYYKSWMKDFESLSTYAKTCRCDIIIKDNKVLKCRDSTPHQFLEVVVDNYLKGEEKSNA